MIITILVLLILKPGTVNAASPVTFENLNPCALKGSSVEFRCSYNYSDKEIVSKTAWFKGELKDGLWKRVALSSLLSYQNRTEYVGDLQHDCSLAIHDLQDNDTGHYYFRFDTDAYGWRSKGSVYLTVTELSATVYPDSVRAGDNVTLECKTSCQLPSMVWFKDGRQIAKPEFQAQGEDSGNYVCAIEGQESATSEPVLLDVQYPPLNVSVEVNYSGHLTVDSSVNLTCSSAANPPADNYTWYRGTVSSFSSMVQVGSGQVLPIPSLGASPTFYICQAWNPLGEDKSSEVPLIVDGTDSDANHLILLVGVGVKVVIVLLLTLVIIWACLRRWRRKSAVDKEENSCDYENVSSVQMSKRNNNK
ncbi:cell adhesion molecule CEACAM6-like [Chaetodon trifascialis]|uniref:cell adhesion molecule CEACAM6-like n=1 Tax=Chaetodon trifascialis TaxID=109706 RepID=UPI0039911116